MEQRLQHLAKLPQDLAFLIALGALHLALLLSAAAVVVLLGISFLEFWHALGARSGTQSHETFQFAIKGVEHLFLAPLPFLVVCGVLRYVEALRPRHLWFSSKSEDRHDAQSKARSELVFLKAFTVSLFIAAIGASLVGRALSPEGLTIEVTISSILVIAVLGAYYYTLETLSTHSSELRQPTTPASSVGMPEGDHQKPGHV